MFRGQDALFETFWRVAGLDAHFGLAEHFARIELLRDDVYRAAGDSIARLECPGVGVEPSILG